MRAIAEIANRHGLFIVEDSAQALGSKCDGRFAGTFGRAGVFSFYPAKILGCFGDGGAVVTNDDAIAERLIALRDHGRTPTGEVVAWGLNSRLDNLQAAILDFQFKDYGRIIAHRRALAERYEAGLGDLEQLHLPPAPNADSRHFDVYQNYEIEAERRDELREYLRDRGVGTIIQWGGKAVHQFSGLGFAATLPRTELLFKRCLMLPMNMMVSLSDVDTICTIIRNFYSA
jgi:dTDP-4-amino-4,6-dideoxygalactose transaminase